MDDLSQNSLEVKELPELLAHPPGDGVTIQQTDDVLYISVQAQVRQKLSVAGLIISMMLFIVACVGCTLLIELTGEVRLTWLLVFAVVTLIGVVAGVISLFLVILPANTLLKFELTANRVRLRDKGDEVELPKADIRSVSTLQKKKREWQLRASRSWPWASSDADGIAIEVPEGSMDCCKDWHESVTVWIASVLAAWSGAPLIHEQAAERPRSQPGRLRKLPKKVERKQTIQIGILLCLISTLLLWVSWLPVTNSFAADQWRRVDATIEAIDDGPPQHRGPPVIRIVYSYSVDGRRFTNDRHSLAELYMDRLEFEKAPYHLGQEIDVWVDPDDPQNSTIDRSFAVATFVLFLFFAILEFVGIGCIVWGLFKRDSLMAKKYAK